MKQFRITFTEQEMTQFESIIGEIPTKWGNLLINLYVPKLQETIVPDEKIGEKEKIDPEK